jgi:hypothetical protein
VKHLLYTEKYTIEGARQKVDEHRKGGELRAAARAALTVQTLDSLEAELKELIHFLAPEEGASETAAPAAAKSSAPRRKPGRTEPS